MDKVIIGGGQGFWGDSNDAAIHMVHTAPLDYMACDYLAELTMSILARQKIKNPAAGFARDFLGLYKACGEEAFRKNIGILTNAGGMNIEGCVDGVKQIAEEKGAKRVFLEVRVSNAPAMSMYLKYGFCGLYARSRYYADGEDALVMVKELG